MKQSTLSISMYAGLLMLGVLLLIGCLKEGVMVDGTHDFQLVVVPSAQKAEVGDTMNFDILLLGEIVNADLFVNNKRVSGHQYVFPKQGFYTIHAEKEGFKNSDSVEIQVGEGKSELKLEVSETQITAGDSVSFAALVLGDTIDAEIYVNTIKLSENKYVFDDAGTFKAYAIKEGYVDSDTIEIAVTEVQLPKLSLSVSKKKIEVDEYVRLSPMYFQGGIGQPMKDAKVYVDDELVQIAMEGGFPFMWKSDETGTFQAYATQEGYDNSDTVEITVTEKTVQPQMILIPSETEVTEGATVTFSVEIIDGGEHITVPGAAYVLIIDNGNPIRVDEFTFDHAGEYTVIAASRLADGYENSDPVIITVSESTISFNVNVVGFEGTSSSSKAMLWEGSASQAVTLGDGIATDIYNFHGGIYISGYEWNTSGDAVKAKYWDSFQEEIILENGNSRANSLMVEPIDGGVLVGGSMDAEATYWLWENSVPEGLGAANTMYNDAFWEEGEITAIGVEIENGQPKATIWAWGDRWGLAPNDSYSEAKSLVVDNSTRYVSGQVNGQAVYWESGSRHDLTTPSGLFSIANAIALKNNDLCFAGNFTEGNETHHAVIWIDGNMYKLNGTNEEGGANDLVIDTDGTIYVAGWIANKSDYYTKAVYWQVDASGNVLETIELTDGTKNAEATGIVMGD